MDTDGDDKYYPDRVRFWKGVYKAGVDYDATVAFYA